MFLIEVESLGRRIPIFGTLSFYVNELRMSVMDETESGTRPKCNCAQKKPSTGLGFVCDYQHMTYNFCRSPN
jgi:hypothetical protein